MKIVVLIVRILMGVAFLFFGANGLFNFIPQPPMPPGLMKDFSTVMAASHYMAAVGLVEIVASVLLLINRYVPLALVLIGPVIVNILIFHILIAPASIGPGVAVAIFWFVLFFSVKSAFAGIFQAKVQN